MVEVNDGHMVSMFLVMPYNVFIVMIVVSCRMMIFPARFWGHRMTVIRGFANWG